MHHRSCLQRGTNSAVIARRLERGRHHLAHLPDTGPAFAKLRIEPAIGDRVIASQMHRILDVLNTGLPGFLRREGEDRGKPCRQALIDLVHHRAAGAPFDRVGRITIEPVLADLEIEGRQIAVTQRVQFGENTVEVITLGHLADTGINLGKAVQHPAFQCRHLVARDSLICSKSIQRTQKIAQRITETTVVVSGPLDDLLADPQIVVIVRADDPQPQDVGAILVHHLLRGDHIAKRLRHLPALLVENKAVSENALVGCTTTGGAGLQKRRVEPATMLVGAFEIQVCRADKVVALLENE